MKKKILNDIKYRSCCDCDKKITFQEFCRDNPWLKNKKILELWEDPLLTIYCPNCFFNRPEKPFVLKKRIINS